MANYKANGLSRGRTYTSWRAMIGRCRNPNHTNFWKYGQKGIAVCDRWLLFANFFADMGERPSGCSLDRIDCNGNYEPGNCRWATTKEQARARRALRQFSTAELEEELLRRKTLRAPQGPIFDSYMKPLNREVRGDTF